MNTDNTVTLSEMRTLFLASLGGALEFYDFIVFAFFAPVLGKVFFSGDLPDWVRQVQTYGIFAAGYFARPLGGIVMAHFGDVCGRKRIFTLSVFLMAIPTLLIGSLPTYRSIGIAAPLLLLAMRVMQGIAIGGEAPGAWIFVAEHASRGRVGFAVGLLTAGLSSGIFLGSIVAVYINAAFSPVQINTGIWRLPFLLGGIFGFIAMFLRRWLAETPVFQEMRRRATIARELPIGAVLRDYKAAVARGVLSTWMLTASIVVVILISPSLLESLFHIARRSALQANLGGCAALCFSVVAVGAATDRFGIRRVSIVMSGMLILGVYALFIGAERTPSALMGFYFFAGIGAGCAVLSPIALVAAFPPEFRFTGVSVSYNAAYAVFGGLTPIIVSWLVHISPLGAPHYVAVATIAGVVSTTVGPWLEGRADEAKLVSTSDGKSRNKNEIRNT